ncbi:hypothetical protein D3C80_1815520 [compost metagenome]
MAEPFNLMVNVLAAVLLVACGALPVFNEVTIGAAETAPVERARDKVKRTALVFRDGLMCVSSFS